MALWVPISATLFRRAVLMLWLAFLLLGLRFFPSFLLFVWWPPLFFIVRKYYALLTSNLYVDFHFLDYIIISVVLFSRGKGAV
jgi:hypothetical protein